MHRGARPEASRRNNQTSRFCTVHPFPFLIGFGLSFQVILTFFFRGLGDSSGDLFLGWWSVTSLGGLHLGRVYFQQSKTPPERTPKINLTRHPQMANQKSCDWRNLSAAKRAAREGKLEVASTKRWGKVSINLQRILEKKGQAIILLWSNPMVNQHGWKMIHLFQHKIHLHMVDRPFVCYWNSTCNFVANAQPPISCEAFARTIALP